MAAPFESTVNPFVHEDVTPTPFEQPGVVGVPPVRITVGLKGGTKTFTTSYSYSRSTKLGSVHTESPTTSTTIAKNLNTEPGSKVTRSTHTVRCRSANNQFFVDVEVLDGLSLTLPNGVQISYSLQAANPFITDKTGDGNGTGGTGASSTRSSHMQRYTGIANPKMCFDAEVCDAFTVTGPNNTQFLVRCPTPWWAAPGSMPPPQIASGPLPLVADNTGSGLATSPNLDQATRAQHVVKLTKQLVNGQQVSSNYLLVYLTDALAYQGPATTRNAVFRPDTDGSGISSDKER